MGFEDTLMNFLMEARSDARAHGMVGAFRSPTSTELVDKLKPDIILSMTTGVAKNLFMSPETWREFIKPQ
jgi:hypothetical protein